jgi:hypothetical protein
VVDAVSVERKGAGGLRLACDGDWCAKKFSPQITIAEPKALRWRATMYGWLTRPEPQQQPTIPGVDAGAAAKLRDLCPECRRTHRE